MLGRSARPLVVALVSIALVLAVVLPSSAEVPATSSARHGVRYLIERQGPNGSFPGFSPVGSTADAVIAMASARRGRAQIADALRFLERNLDEASLGQRAKIVLAVVAAGRDPRAFGGRDLVAEIEGEQQENGQYGPADGFAEVNTHALASLALAAAGKEINDPAADWLVEGQCPDGGWQFDRPHQASEDEHCFDDSTDPMGQPVDFTTSDTNTTSYVVQALATRPRSLDLRADPFDYFRTAKDRVKGGFRYSHEREQFGEPSYTDANSTALVIQAYRTRGSIPVRALPALKELQYARCGSLQGAFAYTWKKVGDRLVRSPSRKEARAEEENGGSTVAGATIGAIQGLMKEPLPLEAAAIRRGAPGPTRCKL